VSLHLYIHTHIYIYHVKTERIQSIQKSILLFNLIVFIYFKRKKGNSFDFLFGVARSNKKKDGQIWINVHVENISRRDQVHPLPLCVIVLMCVCLAILFSST
jgi:hypothetical protein